MVFFVPYAIYLEIKLATTNFHIACARDYNNHITVNHKDVVEETFLHFNAREIRFQIRLRNVTGRNSSNKNSMNYG